MSQLMTPQWITQSDGEALAARLADYVAARLQRALERERAVTLLVSGGRSPARFFELLSSHRLEWGRVTIMPVDERLVPKDSDLANEALIRRQLLRDRASDAGFVSILEQPDAPEQALDGVPWPPVVAVLGMGSDGHTASWFPHDGASLDAMTTQAEACYVRTRAPRPPIERLTLNGAALAQANERILLIQGDDKRDLLEYILENTPEPAEYPVAALIAMPLTVFWSP